MSISIPIPLTQKDLTMVTVGAIAAGILVWLFKPSVISDVGAIIRAKFDTGGGRPRGDVGILDAYGSYQMVNFLFDTGNDITLITEESANKLGLDWKKGQPFTVVGVGGEPKTFFMVMRPIKIGNDDPIVVRIGVGDTPENLLGYQDVAPNYRIVYDKNQAVLFEEAGSMLSAVGQKVAVSSNHDSMENRAVDKRFWWY